MRTNYGPNFSSIGHFFYESYCPKNPKIGPNWDTNPKQ